MAIKKVLRPVEFFEKTIKKIVFEAFLQHFLDIEKFQNGGRRWPEVVEHSK